MLQVSILFDGRNKNSDVQNVIRNIRISWTLFSVEASALLRWIDTWFFFLYIVMYKKFVRW